MFLASPFRRFWETLWSFSERKLESPSFIFFYDFLEARACVRIFVWSDIFSKVASLEICRSHFLWPRFHLLWRRSHLLWHRSRLLWPRSHLLWPRSYLLWPRSHFLWPRSRLSLELFIVSSLTGIWPTDDFTMFEEINVNQYIYKLTISRYRSFHGRKFKMSRISLSFFPRTERILVSVKELRIII